MNCTVCKALLLSIVWVAP